MKKGDIAKLKMERSLTIGEGPNDAQHLCEVLCFDESKECVELVVKEGELRSVSLNGIYRCEIHTEQEHLWCTGRIVERYQSEAGRIVCLKVENGFYKISIK